VTTFDCSNYIVSKFRYCANICSAQVWRTTKISELPFQHCVNVGIAQGSSTGTTST